MRKNKIIRSGLVVLVIRIGGACLQLVLVALAVALFPIADVGVNALLWSTAVIGRVGGTFGLDLHILREFPILWSNTKSGFGLQGRRITKSLGLWLLPAAFGAILVGLWSSERLDFSRELAIALPLAFVLSAFHRLWTCQLRARGQLLLSQGLDAVALPFTAIVFLIASWAWAPHFFLLGQTASIAVISLVMALLLLRDWRQPGRVRYLSAREWRKIAPLGVGTVLSVIASRSPMFLVGAHSISQVASYEIGQRINSAAALASASATSVLFPRVKGLILKKDGRQLWRELFSSVILGLVPALMILVLLLVLGAQRTEMFLGPEYIGTWAVAVVLAATACISSVTGLCHGLLAMAGSSTSFWLIAAIQATGTIVYGVWFFDGSALDMAKFTLIAEIFRGAILSFLTIKLFRSIKPTPAVQSKEIYQ